MWEYYLGTLRGAFRSLLACRFSLDRLPFSWCSFFCWSLEALRRLHLKRNPVELATCLQTLRAYINNLAKNPQARDVWHKKQLWSVVIQVDLVQGSEVPVHQMPGPFRSNNRWARPSWRRRGGCVRKSFQQLGMVRLMDKILYQLGWPIPLYSNLSISSIYQAHEMKWCVGFGSHWTSHNAELRWQYPLLQQDCLPGGSRCCAGGRFCKRETDMWENRICSVEGDRLDIISMYSNRRCNQRHCKLQHIFASNSRGLLGMWLCIWWKQVICPGAQLQRKVPPWCFLGGWVPSGGPGLHEDQGS